MDRKKIIIVLLIGLVLVMAISGCRPKEDPLAEEARQTNVAQTVAAQFTKTAIARPTNTPIPTATTAPTATATAAITAIPTAAMGTTPSPQATTTKSAPTASTGVDAGVWTRSAPADDSIVDSGAKFTVVVTLMNTGTTTWTTD